ncbi:MAG: hemerythrin domain-containing protein [Gammaproteobacteria bacterium]|nr:hemerythrin domain-containing protein [Rhodocyclaceae bacterium]MBU3910391.1 hemerythrin domain-containing protein [Gammaproteobacteria bacterium]MBU3988602.1 hemerythrin domain-containing protein [Gammaproteobacteria bacterium]MBU4004872.1 hemerythrin domain-containing protein [Gammaproteobacteria bacterium]MBU4020465.1 hemerythrin domain-containing protein [Gammaproteobacteria bacterium]
MTMLTEPLRLHHKHCDDLFADAEAAAAERNWPQCQELLSRLHDAIEDHFRTEETVLFPAFEAATGMTGGPTQMMRIEHARMRELLGQMQSALSAQAADVFAGAAETLLIFMQQHNMKEENILYPMCDRSLAEQAADLAAQLRNSLEPGCATKK